MPRDAPVPDTVARLEMGFDTADRHWTVSHWLFMPDLAGQTPVWAEYFFEQLGLNVAGPYLEALHAGVSLGTCRLHASGITYTDVPPARGGSWAGGQTNSVVCCLRWIAETAADSHRALTHLSGVPDAFVDENVRLSPQGISTLTHVAQTVLRGLKLLPTPTGLQAVPVTLRRRAGGQPLPAAEVGVIISSTISPQVSTMRRRMPTARQFPPYV